MLESLLMDTAQHARSARPLSVHAPLAVCLVHSIHHIARHKQQGPRHEDGGCCQPDGVVHGIGYAQARLQHSTGGVFMWFRLRV